MIRIVENTTGSVVDVIDIGISVPASGTYDLGSIEKDVVAMSNDIIILIGDGTLKLQDDTGVPTYWTAAEAIRILSDIPAKSPTDSATKKRTVHESSRPQIEGKKFNTYWTGSGDDMATPAIGKGNILTVQTTISQATTSVDVEFHKDYGDVYLHEGYVMWENAGWGDYIDVEVIANPTPLQQSTNLDYTIDASVKIRAAAGGPGTGTDGLAGDPVWVPNTAGTGWWDIVGGSAVFSSGQTGAYDWYTIEILANRFMNQIPVYGSSTSYVMLQSADTIQLPAGYVVRITANNISDTVWKAWMMMTLYREQTV